MNESVLLHDAHYQRATHALEHTLAQLKSCSDTERTLLRRDFAQLQEMLQKLTLGRIEIVVFGEISTGKSALINALVGYEASAVDVQGGWTKEVWHVPWEGSGYRVPGLAASEVVLVDTPGLNEVGGQERGELAQQAAERADLILFVTDSDFNDTEFTALSLLVRVNKPLIVVLNKIDLYSRDQRERLLDVICNERLAGMVDPADVVTTAADPREIEHVIESASGKMTTQWRQPPPDVESLKVRILELLSRDGLALIALNAAMYAADRSDRIAALRVQVRDRQAGHTVWSYAVIKSLAVALNPVPLVDTLGGVAVDATMVATLAHIYGLEMSWMHARGLVTSILKAAGWAMLAEGGTHLASMTFKALTLGYGTVLTAIPQGAAAGYGSYIVGQAAKFYFEHGASWGSEGPKSVVQRILDETDKESVIERLKDEIRKRMTRNPHAAEKK
jgi:small GTP-binding protein